MSASEREIESAIEKLKSSPVKFQNLVERYARFNYAHRFKHIVPLGRNPNNVPVKGWPDVYSLTEDFRLCVAEATHSPDWPKHLEEDIEKAEALGRGRFSSFLFVAWDNEPSPLTDHQKPNPRYEKLVHFRERLIALDIPPDSISFVFKKQLVHALSQPRFATVLKEILELPCHSLPFQLIREARLFGPPRRREAFAPAEKEYREGLVHRGNLADEVAKRLSARGWAWVRGRGAAGKTVLAIQIALDYEGRSYPAYYLNLVETDLDVSEALDALTTYADEQVLFIIDNAHLDEGVARDIFNQWQKVSLGSHLLLLGRDVTVTDVRGRANPLEDLRAEALTLTVGPDDLAGIYHRLARRLIAFPATFPAPSTAVLQSWQALFGGDLIAFSAAVARRISQLTQEDWRLQSGDAANYVREAYLDNASDDERINLMRLGVLAQLEIDVPAEALRRAGIRGLLKSGLVHQVSRGRDQGYDYYRLIHPGLGDLLLTAADYSAEVLREFSAKQFCYVAQRKPLWGGVIAARLEAANRVQDAIAVLQSILVEGGGIGALVKSGLNSLQRNCERLVRLGLLSEEEIEKKLTIELSALSEGALRTPFSSLAAFLDHADRNLPQVFVALQRDLAKAENLETLSQTALRTPLNFLATFLSYADRKLPEVFDALQSSLAQPENLATLGQTALRTPLGDLATFLDYAKRELEDVFVALRSELSRAESLGTITQTALRTPLHFLVKFLDYADQNLPQVFVALQRDLAKAENLETLSQTALRTPLNFLATFLSYADRKLPEVFDALQSSLAQPENLATLGQTALRTPLGDLATFLDYAKRELEDVFVALRSELSRAESLGTLTQTALRTPLHFLVKFLDYAERNGKEIFVALQRELAKTENLETLSQTALQTPFHLLVTFLDYAESKLPAASKALNSKLAEAKSIEILAQVANRESLAGLLRFLRTAKIASAVVAAIDENEWNRSRLADEPEQPSFFHNLAKELKRLGRPELAEAPARVLISAADPRHWHVHNIGLTQLSEVMRLAQAGGSESVLRFLHRIVTPSWLEEQYQVVPAGPLSASLFGLWGSWEGPVLDHFKTNALSGRLAVEMKRLNLLNPKFLSAALQLLGCSALIDVHIHRAGGAWPNNQQVNDAIRQTTPAVGMTEIGYIQIQLWLGLREMARLRSDRIVVPGESAGQILQLWKNTKGNGKKQQILNAWMIDWLEKSERFNWVLTADSTPWADMMGSA